MTLTNPYEIFQVGDHAITVAFGNEIDAHINGLVINFFDELKANPIPCVVDLIPAYASLTIVYDIVSIWQVQQQRSASEWIKADVLNRLSHLTDAYRPAGSLKRIPVCYAPSLAPDLDYVASTHQLTTNEVITLHTAHVYRVYMLGFLPGFPYLATVHPKIATPRKAQPRKLVPAGSVGIAGEQTGIYALPSPGGWQLIGQTPVQMFKPDGEQPVALSPGDQVQFYSISLQEFNHLKA
ncbi:5-oxoprolinase subunit PxpB [Segetibacter sp. 3557_3]|uniref:5-oxoprolinase subunit PxpB n=1 Tax=Segetibacter sp. 3557_3 TaxID=2547429 RepID=UPI00105891DC|nr:5-oxoprolinase subunit PxpB [Segetibacter sp. 3557_3]TDH25266.1 5-oxoprolinase subunit PxpB [Segetibacter sp. 3557_3]